MNNGHCRRSKDKFISDVLLETLERPVRTYIEHLCADTGCNQDNLRGAKDERDGWRKRVKETL